MRRGAFRAYLAFSAHLYGKPSSMRGRNNHYPEQSGVSTGRGLRLHRCHGAHASRHCPGCRRGERKGTDGRSRHRHDVALLRRTLPRPQRFLRQARLRHDSRTAGGDTIDHLCSDGCGEAGIGPDHADFARSRRACPERSRRNLGDAYLTDAVRSLSTAEPSPIFPWGQKPRTC
jgi:hypothetical protein